MYRIGLTGNIATGKSLVLDRLAQRGAFCVDADKIAHAVMAQGEPAWETIRGHFGPAVLDPQGEIDRVALGRIVFGDADELQALEHIVHPRVSERVEAILAAKQPAVAVVEAIKLIESGMAERCQSLWVTTCSPRHQMRRLVRDRKLSRDDARSRIEAQPPAGDKVYRADVLLENDSTKTALLDLVDAEWREVEDGRAPGMGPGPQTPFPVNGAWHVREGAYQAVALPAGEARWRLLASSETRMPRLFRPLVRWLGILAASRWNPPPSLLVPRRTGYCQFMQGLGYVEAEDDGADSGEALFHHRFG